MKETVSPYRMRTANLLPKFGSPKNPFAPALKAEPVNPERTAAPAAPVPVSAAKPAPVKSEPVKMETISLFDAKPVESPAPVKVMEAQPMAIEPVKAEPAQTKLPNAVKTASARKRMPLAEWMKKVNPLQYLPAREQGAKKAIRSKGARTPVQAELSLEKVKVVRNDLSDTDLEIIPAKLAKPAELPNVSGPAIQPMTKTEPTTWNRMTSRVLGAGQTLIR